MTKEETDKPHRFETIRAQMLSDGAPILKKSLKISGKDLIDMGFEGEAISAALEELWRDCVINPKNNTPEHLFKMAEKLPKR